MSWDGFNLHEWEKDKLDEMVAYNREQKGLKDGINQGVEQGIKQNIEQTIKEMLKNNLDLELISKITKKSVDEIIEIQESIIDKENLS